MLYGLAQKKGGIKVVSDQTQAHGTTQSLTWTPEPPAVSNPLPRTHWVEDSKNLLNTSSLIPTKSQFFNCGVFKCYIRRQGRHPDFSNVPDARKKNLIVCTVYVEWMIANVSEYSILPFAVYHSEVNLSDIACHTGWETRFAQEWIP